MLGFLGLYSVVLKSYGFLIFLSKKIGSLIVGKASCADTEKRLEQLSRRWDEVCGGGGIKRNLRDVDELKATIAAAARAAGVGVVKVGDVEVVAQDAALLEEKVPFLVLTPVTALPGRPWLARRLASGCGPTCRRCPHN